MPNYQLKELFPESWRCIQFSHRIEGWLTDAEADQLFKIAKYHTPNQRPIAVELGSWKGKSSVMIAGGLRCKDSPKLYCVDPFGRDENPESQAKYYDPLQKSRNHTPEEIFRRNIQRSCTEDIVIALRGYSFEVATKWIEPIDLLFIDASHGYDAVLRDFETWSTFLKPEGVIAFHDVSSDWPGPSRVVWERIKFPEYGPVQQVDSLAWAIKYNDTARVNLSPRAHTEIVNVHGHLLDVYKRLVARDVIVQRQSTQIRSLHDKQGTLEQGLASRDETIRAQENELQTFRTSKLQRLRSSILYEKLSARKVFKIIYLITALATPERVRIRLSPLVRRLKRTFESAAQPGPTIERRGQEKWPEDRPLVSVVIPSFNYGRYLEETVDSVLSQTFQDLEIIVTDGGSTDEDTLRVLRSFQKAKTKVYLNEGRHLLGDNRNLGIQKARGKYICCLDSDDKLKPTYLEKALFLLETYHYDIVSPAVQCFGSSDFLWRVPARPSLEEITRGNQFSVVAVYAKQMWQEAGGYHDWGLGEDLVAEDWDLWVRMMALGARAANISEALMLYRVHNASMSKQANVRPWAEQAKEILKFNKKHLKRKNYRLSAKRNAAIVRVDDPYLNLVASYRKQPKKPAILLALPYVITGGADTVFLGMAEHLVANGFDLSIVTTIPAEASFGDNTAKYEAITKQVYHLYKFLDEETQWKDFLFYLIESRSVDVLLLAGSSYVYSLLPQIKKRFPHLKVVDHLYNERGHIENNRKYRDLIDTHIVVNDSLKGILMDRFAEMEDSICVIKPGVDVKGKFNPDSLNGDQALPAGILPPDKFFVFFVGRFSEEKCPEKFVDVAHLLKDDANIHFVMLGSGPEYSSVKEKISALGLDDRIYAPGTVSDVRPYMRIADVVVIPSATEGLPVTMMESMALGVPVIASAVGGIPSVIRDSFNGFVCDPSDIDGFVRNIRRIAKDDGLSKTMKVNAREYALRHLDIDRTIHEYRDLFSELISAKHG